MREIIFRGKRTDNGEWVYGSFIPDILEALENRDMPDGFIKPFGKTKEERLMVEVERETVGQFTGLYDRNGVKIFEGDIITNRYFDNGVVSYCDGAFEVNGDGVCATFHENFDGDRCEVIGNIHDNPELLEG